MPINYKGSCRRRRYETIRTREGLYAYKLQETKRRLYGEACMPINYRCFVELFLVWKPGVLLYCNTVRCGVAELPIRET